jgi:polysaccharide pyruvyl transferase WcaK-like protein
MGFLAGNVFMLVVNTTMFWQPPQLDSIGISPSRMIPSDNHLKGGCHGLQDTRILLLDVHLEGNLGDEMETMPLLEELRRCGVHTTVVLSGWLEGPEKQLGYRSVRQHYLVDDIQLPGNYERFVPSDYDAIVLAPGPWRLCQINKWWPYPIDVFMGGSILLPQDDDDCDSIKVLDRLAPSLMVLRETTSYNHVQTILPASLKHTTSVVLSGDLTHSLELAPASLTYWKRTYSRLYKNKILIFSRASNIANVVKIVDRTVRLVTYNQKEATPTVLPAKTVVFATSSALEDESLFVDWKHKYFDRFQEHQFVVCDTVEQLFGLISWSQHVYTDRYHPGVVAHRLGKNFTILKYESEQSKLVGLAELVATDVSASTIRNEYNQKAFSQLRETLRTLRAKRKATT